MIIEVMGRYTGWIALDAGTAGGSDVILISEKTIQNRRNHQVHQEEKTPGKKF
jgi:6-phosphofructokinase